MWWSWFVLSPFQNGAKSVGTLCRLLVQSGMLVTRNSKRFAAHYGKVLHSAMYADYEIKKSPELAKRRLRLETFGLICSHQMGHPFCLQNTCHLFTDTSLCSFFFGRGSAHPRQVTDKRMRSHCISITFPMPSEPILATARLCCR